jgi:hypothetical protein
MGLPALNIGLSKGSTYDRALSFPTKPMLAYLRTAEPDPLKAPDRLYVAVTRARHSVAFVVDQSDATYVPSRLPRAAATHLSSYRETPKILV